MITVFKIAAKHKHELCDDNFQMFSRVLAGIVSLHFLNFQKNRSMNCVTTVV